jgi:hypothetical protein
MTNLLSSDILEAQFGPTEVVVLHQNGSERIICTKVLAGGQVLELSRVLFEGAGVEKFPEVHRAVVAGQSMGKAFRAAGIEFVRETKGAYQQLLPASLKRWFDSSEAATVVDVSILVGADQIPYAQILEVYSPAVYWPSSSGRPMAERRLIIDRLDKFLSRDARTDR